MTQQSLLLLFVLLATITPHTWIPITRLNASDASATDRFGSSVALTDTLALIGAPQKASTSTGAAYVFERQSNSAWIEIQILLPANASSTTDLDPSSLRRSTQDLFGAAVAILDAKDQIALFVGAPGTSMVGAVYIFVRPVPTRSKGIRDGAATFVISQQLSASDPTIDSRFGESIALLERSRCAESLCDADLVAIGAPECDLPVGSDAGAVYIFTRSTGSTWEVVAKIVPLDNGEPDEAGAFFFGTSVALEGGNLFVGAPMASDPQTNSQIGRLYMYRITSQLGQKKSFGKGSRLEAESRMIATAASFSFNLVDTVEADSPQDKDMFGQAVGAYGVYVFVGCPGRDASGVLDSGAVYVYKNVDGSALQYAQLMVVMGASMNDMFGSAGSITSNSLYLATNTYRIHSFLFDGDQWGFTGEVVDGGSVAVSALQLFRIRGSAPDFTEQGSAYIDYDESASTASPSNSPSRSASASSSLSPSYSPSASTSKQSSSYTPSLKVERTPTETFTPSASQSPQQIECYYSEPVYSYVECYVNNILSVHMTLLLYRNSTSDIYYLSGLMNKEIGTPNEYVGADSKLESRLRMSAYLDEISSYRSRAPKNQQPNVSEMSFSSYELYFDLKRFGPDDLFVGCNCTTTISSFAPLEGIDEKAAEALCGAAENIAIAQQAIKIETCDTKKIFDDVSYGLLLNSNGSTVVITTTKTSIFAVKDAPQSLPKSVAISSDVEVYIGDISSLISEPTVLYRVVYSQINPYTQSLSKRFKTGSVISPVVSVSLEYTNYTAIPITANNSIIEIYFEGNEDYFPKDDTNELESGFLYEGDFQPKICINDEPICSAWSPASSSWSSADTDYFVVDGKPKPPRVKCTSKKLSDFSIFLEPVDAKDGCSDSWVVRYHSVFVVYSAIYSCFLGLILYQVVQLAPSTMGCGKQLNPAPFLLHISAALLMLCRLVYFLAASANILHQFSELLLIFLLSSAIFLLFLIYSLMVFIWIHALLSKNTSREFLGETKKYFFFGLLIILINLAVIWIGTMTTSGNATIAIATYGSISLAVIR
eukprot:TRINITY_DN1334_c1_g3_i1.p1 TRINITY_DN1334_c1_g3~~TRINITY_DN1334_c1_g3_i1.p1  ORF type:complete len:1052 (-),score=200.22 TRINITY_DN1334_c1_g3_i1:32-3187(-)